MLCLSTCLVLSWSLHETKGNSCGDREREREVVWSLVLNSIRNAKSFNSKINICFDIGILAVHRYNIMLYSSKKVKIKMKYVNCFIIMS